MRPSCGGINSRPSKQSRFVLCGGGCLLVRQQLSGSALLVFRGQTRFIPVSTHVTLLRALRLLGLILTGGQSRAVTLVRRGPVRGAEGVCGAELDGCRVLQGVLAHLHLKGDRPHPHQPPLLPSLGFPSHVGRGSPANHAAGREESQSQQQEEGPNDDGRVGRQAEGAEGESSDQGDVDAGQHDAQAAGAAQSRGGQVLVPQAAPFWDVAGNG